MAGFFRQLLVYTLISLLIFPPAAMAQGGIVPDAGAQAGKRPGMDNAANGVPVVNITTPNGSGLSHNQYSDFNVGKKGAILNNSAQDSVSQLGGIVHGNQNLGGGSAKTILNEVTSSNRSHIQGYIEVTGQRADVILANPNGITINGGGFINVGRGTMTTGKPEFDAQGALKSFEVRQGDVRIEGDGLNANNLTAFDIISRAAEINASIYAEELNIVTGQNSYDPATGKATPLADDGSAKPKVAIDSTALGGMYAGRITLTSTEKGVGVNLQGVVQSVNDMEITANGQLALRAAQAGGSVMLASTDDISVAEAVIADKNLQAKAVNMTLSDATLGAKNNLDIQMDGTFTATNGAELAGGNNASIKAASIKVEDSATVKGGNVSLQAGNVSVSDAVVAASDKLEVAANEVSVSNAAVIEGDMLAMQGDKSIAIDGTSTVMAQQDATLTAGDLTNRGLIFAANDLVFRIKNTLSNLDGADILAVGDITFEGLAAGSRMNRLHNQASGIESLDGDINVYAQSFFNDGGNPTTRRVQDGYDYKFIGWVGDRANLPKDSNNNFKVTPELYDDLTIPYYAYGPNGQKNYISVRNYLIKSEGVVKAYVQEMYDLLGIPNELAGKYEGLQEWMEYSYDELVTAATPSRFMAGRNIYMDVGDLTNTYSTISAGNNIEINADTVTNKGLELSRYTDIERAFISTGSSGSYKIDRINKLYYNFAEVISSIPATISAGGSVIINATQTVDNSVIKSGADYAGTSSGIPGFTGFPDGGGWQDGGWMPNINVGALFQTNTDPGHKYLIETNPNLTSFGNYYGSEYFLDKIGYDLVGEQTKLLGDAYFETRFVRDQLLAQTGQRYLYAGVTDDADTMRMLMDNAALEQSGLGLAVGVSLTPEQIAGLTRDIIWLEEMEYEGQIVLVPRLYLCDATKAELEVRGSNINGTMVTINSTDITNQGAISGQDVTLTASNDVINRGGSLSGSNALVVNADGSILNQSGSLSGGDITLAAGQDVRFETVVDQQRSGAYGNTATVHQVASVNADGNLSVSAGNNIEIAGADVSAGGKASLDAANDVVIASQAVTHSGGEKNSNYSYTTNYGSSVDVGELEINAGNNVTVVGSTVNAQGDAAINAGGDISVLASIDEAHSYFYAKKSGGTFGSSSNQTVKTDSTSANSSLITSGGNMSLNAGDNVLIGGSGLMAGTSGAGSGELNINAGGTVLVTTAEETGSSYEKRSSSSLFSSSSNRTNSNYVTNIGSLLAGDNVNINAGDSILVSGSEMLARDDINLHAATGDVVIAAAQDYEFSDSKNKKSGFGIFTGSNSVDIYRSQTKTNTKETTTSVASELNAGGNINITAGNDITSIGSRIDAGEDISLAAGRDVNILADTNSDYEKSTEKRKAVGVSWESTKDSIGIYDSFSATAGYRSKTTRDERSSTQNVGSGISAGGNLSVSAGDNINILGSDLESGKDMQLAAGGDINVLSGYDTEYAESYVKEMQYGLRLDMSQTITEAVKSTGNAIYDNFRSKNHSGKDYEADRFQAPSYVNRMGINYQDQVTKETSSQSTAIASSLTSGGNMGLNAGNDINLVGAELSADEKLSLAAGNDVNITAAQEVASTTYDSNRRSISDPFNEQYKGKKTERTTTVTHVGSMLTGNEVSITAGNDIDIAGSTIAANSGIDLTAGNDINIGTVQNEYYSSTKSEEYGIDLNGKYFAAGTKHEESRTTVDIGSNIVSGGDINVNAGGGIDVTASGLYAANDVNLDAVGDVNIQAGEARQDEKKRVNYAGYSETVKATEDKVSQFNGVTYENYKKDSTKTEAIASNMYAGGNININSRDKDVAIKGSNLDSKEDINISAAGDINFMVAEQIDTLNERGTKIEIGALAEAEQSLTGIIRKAIGQTEQTYKDLVNIGDVENVIDGYNLAMSVKDAHSALKNVKNLPKNENLVSARVGGTIGVTHEVKTRDNNAELASTARAGGNINLDAGRDINMQGTQMTAEQDININTGGDLNVIASREKRDESSSKTSGSVFGGLGAKAGPGGNSVGWEVNLDAGYSNQKLKSKVYTNASITAGQGLNVNTGNDATIIGGNLRGDEVNMNIGGDLILASIQDDVKLTGNKAGASVGFTIGLGVAGSGGESDSEQRTSITDSKYKESKGTYAFSATESNFVGTQSTIEGNRKVDIYVENNTHLEGSMINAGNGNLRLDTDTLTYADIHSKQKGFGIGGGMANTANPKGPKEEQEKRNYKGEGSYWPTSWVANQSGKLLDHIKQMDDDLNSLNSRPVDVELTLKSRRQTAFATIGEGEIVIRSNPDQDISDLNRDASNSMPEEDGTNFSLKVKDPAKTVTDVVDIVRDTHKVSGEMVDEGGFFPYIGNGISNTWSKLRGSSSK